MNKGRDLALSIRKKFERSEEKKNKKFLLKKYLIMIRSFLLILNLIINVFVIYQMTAEVVKKNCANDF